MEDLQQAYSAYQQALYHLRDPKVSLTPNPFLFFSGLANWVNVGAETMVWHWHSVRPLWLARARRRSFFASHANAAGL